MLASESLLGTIDVGRIATEALLFQTGYLKMLDREYRRGRWLYRLGYLHWEVRRSLNESLADCLTGDASMRESYSIRLDRLLESADSAGLEQRFRVLFAGSPYQWHSCNKIARFEGYHASEFCS